MPELDESTLLLSANLQEGLPQQTAPHPQAWPQNKRLAPYPHNVSDRTSPGSPPNAHVDSTGAAGRISWRLDGL